MIEWHIKVHGRVQGVFFRQHTIEFVRRENLKITGYVKNMFSGHVELKVIGEQDQIEKLIDFLKVGPPSARVDNLEIESSNIEQNPYTDFIIKFD